MLVRTQLKSGEYHWETYRKYFGKYWIHFDSLKHKPRYVENIQDEIDSRDDIETIKICNHTIQTNNEFIELKKMMMNL